MSKVISARSAIAASKVVAAAKPKKPAGAPKTAKTKAKPKSSPKSPKRTGIAKPSCRPTAKSK